MYSRIINPSNQKNVRVNSVLGKRILRNYINMLVGGSDTAAIVPETDVMWRDPLKDLFVAETDGTERKTLEEDELEYMKHDWKLKKNPKTGEPEEWEYIYRLDGDVGEEGLYTKKEFEDYYDGTDEWDRAERVEDPVPYGEEWEKRIGGFENILSGEYTHHKKIVLTDTKNKVLFL